MQDNDSLTKVRRIRPELESSTLKPNHKNKNAKSANSTPHKSTKSDQNAKSSPAVAPSGEGDKAEPAIEMISHGVDNDAATVDVNEIPIVSS